MENFVEFREALFNPVIDLADIMDYSGRPMLLSLPYLRKHELIPFFPKGKQYLKISVVQLIWLRILDTLRQFSYKVSDMQKLCGYFFRDAYDNGLPRDNMLYNIDLLNKQQLAGTISQEGIERLKFLERAIEDKMLLHVLKFDINYLSNNVIQCVSEREDTGILVFAGGRVMEYDSQGMGNHNGVMIDMDEPHIRLSIKYYLREFIDDDELSTIVMPQLLNQEEQAVLKALSDKSIVELTIKKTNGGGIRIDTVKSGLITGEQAKEIKRILGLSNYEELTMSTRDNKTLHFKKIRKNINSD